MAGKPPIGRGARCHPAALSSCTGVAGGVGTRRVRRVGRVRACSLHPARGSVGCRSRGANRTRTPTSTNEADGDGATSTTGATSDRRCRCLVRRRRGPEFRREPPLITQWLVAARFPACRGRAACTLVTGHGAWLTAGRRRDPERVDGREPPRPVPHPASFQPRTSAGGARPVARGGEGAESTRRRQNENARGCPEFRGTSVAAR